MSQVFTPFTLPCESELSNRLVKAAMEEGLANANLQPDERLFQLYRQWSQGGVGLIITGNVMIDSAAMTGPGGVALEADTQLMPFVRWADAAQSGGSKVWMQINHPGRQVYAALEGKALAPSEIALDMGKHSHLFAKPKAITEEEIQDVISRFVATAKQAEAAGFDGVQIHAAHGYLLSQFLSPLSNKRNDQWGGSAENRMRLVLEVVKAVRSALKPKTAVGIKINSADFQRGGFEPEDAAALVAALNPLGLDMIELSGGSYEAPAMQGVSKDSRTLAREAYFLEFARDIAKVSHVPVMTTGGINTQNVAERVLDEGVDMVGIATAMAFNPALPKVWQQATGKLTPIPQIQWKNKTLRAMAVMAIVKRQLERLSKGKTRAKSMSPVWSLIRQQLKTNRQIKQYNNR